MKTSSASEPVLVPIRVLHGDQEVVAHPSGWRQRSCYRRFAQWSRDRVWARLHHVILDELTNSRTRQPR